MQILAPRGTKDILPAETAQWQYVESVVREICELFGYGEIRLPIFEQSELFARGIGDATDIVQKEMYTFKDRGERLLTLRPEFTAGVVRAYLEHKMYGWQQPVKLFYYGPLFRYERPQAGRQRQFNQFGVEAFGSSDPALDVEIIALACEFLRKIGLTELTVEINSIGCRACRPDFRTKLQEYFKPRLMEMCGDCQSRFETNPLRILDCKNEKCAVIATDAPQNSACLCAECATHFAAVQEILADLNLNIVVNPRLVRGLDYYTKTVFEIKCNELGAQSSVCGGGRYDNLVEEFEGMPTPAVGVAFGLERVIIILQKLGLLAEQLEERNVKVFVAALGTAARAPAAKLVNDLRQRGVVCEMDYMGRSVKAQFKYAGKLNVRYVAVIGDQELLDKTVTIKNMTDSSQMVMSYLKAVEILEGE
ncbi:MAG: histidine--tRNA ligase [Bacillota bacterium]